jgi:hypothetical protein
MEVREIEHKEAYPLILIEHYAHRLPPITFSYGLFDGEELIGVCTYGKPLSSTLRTGVCGVEYAPLVWELNRLCLDHEKHEKNLASWFISRTFDLLPHPSVIVSYADSAQNHRGYVYQALNFIYTGLSAKRTDWTIKGMTGLHSQTISDLARTNKPAGVRHVDYLRATYGDSFSLEKRSRKYRYVMFLGNKREKRKMLEALRYPVVKPYPKEIQDK